MGGILLLLWIAAFMANLHYNEQRPGAMWAVTVVLIILMFPMAGLI